MKKIIFSLCLCASCLFSFQKENIKVEMEKNISSVLDNIKQKQFDKIVPILDPIIDYKTMAKISLSTKWNDLSDLEKNEFSSVFETKLKNNYIDKLKLYTDQDVVIKNLIEPKQNRLELETEIVSNSGEKYAVVYKFFNSNDDWKIYDIDLIGVSILQTYRSQFSGYFKEPNKNINTLIADLQK